MAIDYLNIAMRKRLVGDRIAYRQLLALAWIASHFDECRGMASFHWRQLPTSVRKRVPERISALFFTKRMRSYSPSRRRF